MHHKKGKFGWFALKVELEKAYVLLEWDFVRNCLHEQNINFQSDPLSWTVSIKRPRQSLSMVGKLRASSIPKPETRRPYVTLPFQDLSWTNHLPHQSNMSWENLDAILGREKETTNDLLIFRKVDESTTFKLRDILNTFCEVSGKKNQLGEKSSHLLP